MAFIYVVRLAITMVLIAAAPLALMFHALPVTDGLAWLWWRGITGILAIQVCQSLVLVTAFQLMFSETKDTSGSSFGLPNGNDITDLLLAICLLWMMVRIPSWVAKTIWQPAQPGMLGQMVKSFLIYRGLGALKGKVGKAVRRPPNGVQPPAAASRRPRSLAQPPPAPPPAPTPPTPPSPAPASPPPEQQPGGGQPVQLALPIPAPPRSAARRPVQLALPIPITRVPRPAATWAAAAPPRPRVRSGQLMLPGMPKRPVPPGQLTLWVEPPKSRRPRRNP